MRRAQLFGLLTALALLLAASAWGALALRRQLLGAGEQAPVRRGALEDSLCLSGVVLREEQLLSDARSGLRVLAEEGQRLPAGTPLAIAYDSGEEHFCAALLLRLREAAEPAGAGQEEALLRCSAALARRELPALPQAARALGQSLGLSENEDAEALSGEIGDLSLWEENILRAPAPGVFLRLPDGWEELDPRTLSPSALRARLEGSDAPAAGYGKLVTGSEWSFCALVQGQAAARFAPGDRLYLRLPDGTQAPARVGSVVTEGLDTLVVLRCREHLEEVLALRRAEITVIFERFEGLLLPAAAITEQDGETCVRRAGLPLGGLTAVTVLFTQGELAVVRAEGLREGMAVELRP